MTSAKPALLSTWTLAFLVAASLASPAANATVATQRPASTAHPKLTTTAAREGRSLSVTNGAWANSPVSYHYQWRACNSAGAQCAPISGATTSTYTPPPATVGKRLLAAVTARNAIGETYATSETSAAVAAVTPVNTGPPKLSPGAPREGVAETVTTGTWTYNSSPFSYQWLDCNSGGQECASIPGATTSSYTPRPSDVGLMLEAAVTATNRGLTATAGTGNSERLVLAASTTSYYAPHLDTVFSATTSVWNTNQLGNTETDPSSKSLVETLTAWGAQKMNGINSTASSAPVYTVPANQPTTKVVLDWHVQPLNEALSAVPIPPTARVADGSDQQMVVYQPSTGQQWEFWHMRRNLLAPTSFAASTASGGHLAAAIYYYAVTALSAHGETTPSAPFVVTVPTTGDAVNFTFKDVIDAQGYKLYRGTTPTGLGYLATINDATNEYGTTVKYTDSGTVTPGPAPPTTNTAATPGQWHAGWAGHIAAVTDNPGYYRELTAGSTTLEEPDWGATASSLPIADGLVTVGDLEHGAISHAMQLLVPTTRASVHAFPAQRTDGGETTANSVPEGARFVLSPSYDCAKQSTPFMRMVCVAAQRFGFIVSDQTGGGLALRAEDPTPLMQAGGLDPFPTYFTAASGAVLQPHEMMAAFPWAQLRLLPMKLAAQSEYHN